ncbi:MAG: hypothetical protein ACRET0_00510 [Steroidobacteraceae bacterium]
MSACSSTAAWSRSLSPRLLSLLRYIDGDYADGATFRLLRRELCTAQHPAYYLAIPPVLCGTVVEQVVKSGNASASVRVIAEKPFGERCHRQLEPGGRACQLTSRSWKPAATGLLPLAPRWRRSWRCRRSGRLCGVTETQVSRAPTRSAEQQAGRGVYNRQQRYMTTPLRYLWTTGTPAPVYVARSASK